MGIFCLINFAFIKKLPGQGLKKSGSRHGQLFGIQNAIWLMLHVMFLTMLKLKTLLMFLLPKSHGAKLVKAKLLDFGKPDALPKPPVAHS